MVKMACKPLSTNQRMMKRMITAAVAVVVLCALLAQCSTVLTLTELLYVQGCKDTHPLRSTAGCFAGPKPSPSMTLSLRGLNFPSEMYPAAATGTVLRVQLLESLPLTSLNDKGGEGEHGAAAVPHLELACEDVVLSEVFPTQLLSCTLANPIPSASSSGDEEVARKAAIARWGSTGGSVWFDVVLRAAVDTKEGQHPQGKVVKELVDLAVLRRAVEVDVSATLRRTGLQSMARQKPTVHISDHPLERLYATKPKKQPQQAQGQGQSAVTSEDEEDYLWVELGIGGLKKELRALFRRVFLSRLPSLAHLTESLDTQHVRGVILYGPPGNGKSLIARSLFKLLGPDTRLTVVNAADVLSKYVGESEKNLHDVFGGRPVGTSSQAETERKDGKGGHFFDDNDDDEGENSENGAGQPKKLHVLVIDEFESLFRRRGHSEDESSAKAAYDGVTNTLLSLMDGIESRNDLLVVGLTNRLQSIDSAMLRPGRFEVLIEVTAPDVPAREEIFFIHTAKLREEGYLSAGVTLHDLAVRSGGFSGSDIAGTVRSATSYALLRYRQSQGTTTTTARKASGESCGATLDLATGVPVRVCEDGEEAKVDTLADDPEAFEVTMEDLEKAMADIRSAKDESSSLTYLGVDDDEKAVALFHTADSDTRAKRVANMVDQVRTSRRVFSGVVGLSGAAGTGKTTLAKELTAAVPFDTVRYLSCRRLVELRDRNEQLEQVRDALGEASRVANGLVVLDDFDVLVDSLTGFPVLENTLKNMLYEFRHRPLGVSRSLHGAGRDSLREVSESGGGGMIVNAGSSMHDARNRRFLFAVSTRADVLDAVEPDVSLRVRALQPSVLPTLLRHLNVSDTRDTHRWRVAAPYPPALSFRSFLRVTDMALSACVDRDVAGDSASRKAAAAGADEGDTRGSAGAYFMTSIGNNVKDGRRFAITTVEEARCFTGALNDVLQSKGLRSPFDGLHRMMDFETDEEEDDQVGQEEDEDGESSKDAGEEKVTRLKEVDEHAADAGAELLF